MPGHGGGALERHFISRRDCRVRQNGFSPSDARGQEAIEAQQADYVILAVPVTTLRSTT